MSRIDDIKTEIDTDPLSRGYSGMSDEAVAASMNDTIDRSRNLSSLTGDQIFDATDSTEFAALTDHKQGLWLSFCGRDTIDPFGSSNVAFVQWVFGGGSTTASSLGSLRTESVSRATELGLGVVRVNNVTEARAI